jgi:hypothetical protein
VRKLAQNVATYSELADCDGSTALLRRVPYGYSPGMYLRSSKKRAQPELLYTVPLG